MAEELKQPITIPLEDILNLFLEIPDLEDKVDSLTEQVDTILDNLDLSLDTNGFDPFQKILSVLDIVLPEFDGLDKTILDKIPFLRTLKDLFDGIGVNSINLLSVFSGLIPSSVRSLIGELGGYVNAISGLIQFVTNFNPADFAKFFASTMLQSVFGGLIGGSGTNLAGMVIGLITGQLNLGSIASNFLSNLTGGILNGFLGGIIGGLGGGSCSAAKPMKPLTGGFEVPDSINLSEIHVRFKRKENETASNTYHNPPHGVSQENEGGGQ
jgi:hypothetical protein